MLIEEAEKNLRQKFKFKFEFRESRIADLESNLFFVLAQKEKTSPKEIAEKYLKEIEQILGKFRVEFRGGFLNIFFAPQTLVAELERLLEQEQEYFKGKEGRKINLEFVSANPTGPLHIGNLRGGPAGEVLAQVLRWRGNEVVKEYYVNDLGTQAEKFVDTVLYWIVGDEKLLSFPEGGYQGVYPKEVAKRVAALKQAKDPIAKFRQKEIGVDELRQELRPLVIDLALQDIMKTLSRIGVKFDVVTYESSLSVEPVLEALRSKGCVREKDGAVWFASSHHKELLGDRECVLVRSDGRPTYFLNDIAYHLDKIKRGAEYLIDIWGANHFGHKPRLQAALDVLGQGKKLEVVFYQPVRLKQGGKLLTMAKRKGTYMTADEVLDFVDADVFKVYLLSRTLSSPLEFELEHFKKEAKKSPVFYLKYMSARIHGILRKVKEPNVEADYDKLGESEFGLIKRFVFLPYKIYKTAQLMEPHFLYEEALRLAEAFHRFYEEAPIKGEKDLGLKKARLKILQATLIAAKVLAEILGIELPERM